MIKLGLYVTIRVVNAAVHNPILSTVRVDLETVDHAAAFDQIMCIATCTDNEPTRCCGIGFHLGSNRRK